jgi:hypothetical protein
VKAAYRHPTAIAAVLMGMAGAASVRATHPESADHSIQRFLAQGDTQHAYRGSRRLEANNGGRHGWVEAATSYTPENGFTYQITAEGGSGVIIGKVLRPVLESERSMIAQGESARSSLVGTNYTFLPDGMDSSGLAKVRLSPRRKERVLVEGAMFLQPTDGRLVRLEGRLAKNPSFWVRDVNIVRLYDRIGDAIVPVALESTAQVRMLGSATFRMTYSYSEIDGQPVGQLASQ